MMWAGRLCCLSHGDCQWQSEFERLRYWDRGSLGHGPIGRPDSVELVTGCPRVEAAEAERRTSSQQTAGAQASGQHVPGSRPSHLVPGSVELVISRASRPRAL